MYLNNEERFYLKASTLPKRTKDNCIIIVDKKGVEICQRD